MLAGAGGQMAGGMGLCLLGAAALLAMPGPPHLGLARRRINPRRRVPQPTGRHVEGCHNVLIVGAGRRAIGIAQEMRLHPERKYNLVGFVDDDALRARAHGIELLGRLSDLFWLIDRYQIDEVIVAYLPSWQERLATELVASGRAAHVKLRVVPSLYESMVSDLRIEPVDDIPLVRVNARHPGAAYLAAKRVFDIGFSLVMLVVSSPLMLAAAIAIKLTSEGPALFVQERVGRGGRVFRIYKLRTMVADAEQRTGPVLADPYDARMTTVGRWLRATRLDELPQFVNVIKGDMSVVGPRPERPEFVGQFLKEVPGYAKRHEVRPGITGLAQVYGGYLTTVYSKLRYDWLYLYRCSFWYDLRIIGLTIKVVLSRAGT